MSSRFSWSLNGQACQARGGCAAAEGARGRRGLHPRLARSRRLLSLGKVKGQEYTLWRCLRAPSLPRSWLLKELRHPNAEKSNMQIKCWIYSDFSLNFPDIHPSSGKSHFLLTAFTVFALSKIKSDLSGFSVYFPKISVVFRLYSSPLSFSFLLSFSFPPGARQAIDETKQIIRLAAGFCAY